MLAHFNLNATPVKFVFRKLKKISDDLKTLINIINYSKKHSKRRISLKLDDMNAQKRLIFFSRSKKTGIFR